MNYSDLTLLTLLSGVLVPLLVGILAKLNASSVVKSVLNLGLTAAGTLLAVANETDFDWKVFLVNWSVAWVVSVATYYGFYKPSGVSGAVQEKTANFGVG